MYIHYRPHSPFHQLSHAVCRDAWCSTLIYEYVLCTVPICHTVHGAAGFKGEKRLNSKRSINTKVQLYTCIMVCRLHDLLYSLCAIRISYIQYRMKQNRPVYDSTCDPRCAHTAMFTDSVGTVYRTD